MPLGFIIIIPFLPLQKIPFLSFPKKILL